VTQPLQNPPFCSSTVTKENRSLEKEIEGRKGEVRGVEGARERPNGVGKYKNIKESVGRKFLYISVSGTQ
jgi:hypothetical protein